MDKWKDAPLPDGSYADDSRPYSSQDVVNWIPEYAEQSGGRSRMKLAPVPGLQAFATVGSGPIRGMRNVEGKLFVVSGSKLYQVFPSGGSAQLGTVPGRSRVSMSHNQIAGGNQLAIATGADGYIYNTLTGVFAKVTDAGFPGWRVVDLIDQMFVGVDPQGRNAFNSDLVDGTSYNALESFQSEASPDRIVSAIVSHGELILLGERTTEFFDSTGVTNSLFVPKSNVMERGCGATHSVVNIDNTVMWIGDDGSWYRLNGYNDQRVSTLPVENAVATATASEAFAMVWEDRGHKVVYFTYPDGMTWGYDAATGKIHRRQSKGMDRWRINALAKWNGDWYGGDFRTGLVYRLSWKYQAEYEDELVRRVRTPVLHNDQNRVFVHGIQAKFDTGLECEAMESPVQLTLAGDVAGGYVGLAVSDAYTTTHGTAPIVITVGSGFPPGLACTTGGVVTGTFTTAGDYRWVVTAVDANGVRATLIDSCVVAAEDAAVRVLLNASDWFPFDGDMESILSANVFVHGYGSAVAYETGLIGDQLHGNNPLFSTNTGLSLGEDWSMCWWLEPTDTNARWTTIGVGALGASDVNYYLAAFFKHTGTFTGSAGLRDTGVGGTGTERADAAGYQLIPSGRLFCTLKWDESAKTLFMRLNCADFTSVITAGALHASALGKICIRDAYDVVFADITDRVDELVMFAGYFLTQEDEEYLYNEGVGKSYADVQLDALS